MPLQGRHLRKPPPRLKDAPLHGKMQSHLGFPRSLRCITIRLSYRYRHNDDRIDPQPWFREGLVGARSMPIGLSSEAEAQAGQVLTDISPKAPDVPPEDLTPP
jgi:hypothetical protein